MTRNTSPGSGPAATLLDAAAIALASGLGYWLVLLVRDRGLGQFVWASPHAVWMAPAAYLALFLPIALPVCLASRAAGGRAAAAAFFAWLGVFSLLLPFPQIARWAAAIFAAGVAAQVWRTWRARAPRPRAVGWTVLGLITAAAAGGAAVAAAGALGRSRALAGLGQAPPGAPNVLLVIWDTVRGANLSLHGHHRPTTPGLERLAASATVFDRAIATAPWTLPSHATLFTGRYPGELGGGWRHPVEGGARTLAEVFRDRGYHTGGFVANLLYTSRESGLARGFVDYRDYRISPGLILLHTPLAQTGLFRRLVQARSLRDLRRAVQGDFLLTGRLPADDVVPARTITDDFLGWQASVGNRPFFAFLNYFDAHGPYRAPDSVRRRLGLSGKPLDRYDAAIAHLDDELARLLDTLAARGALDRTIVVVTSDHGELFGEHDLTGHANALYLPLLWVPLVLRYPDAVPAGVRVGETVTLRDLPATLAALAGVPADSAPPGHPLVDRWARAAAAVDGVDGARGGAGAASGAGSPIVAELAQGQNVDSAFPNARTGLRAILDQRYHYVRNGFGAEELFDYVADPEERTNLAAAPDLTDVMARLRRTLDSVTRRP